MSQRLAPGTQIKTLFGGSIKVLEELGEGGQGIVYKVEQAGQKKALKWYKTTYLDTLAKRGSDNPNKFYTNVKNNIMRGLPDPAFLWPSDITVWHNDSFGYVMDLRPDGYYEVADFLLLNVRFASFRTAIDAAQHIVNAFRNLHNAGYCYRDMNDGNFFINPKNGKVLICDNDNVSPTNFDPGIKGKPGYMAPEIVMDTNTPDALSDRYSMAQILFMLFCLNHPLEGKAFTQLKPTREAQRRFYGSEALFMMDPHDQKNAPHPVANKNAIVMWKCLPDYMRQIFTTAFSQQALKRPAARPKEIDWLKVLTRFRSEIVPCACGNEVFTQNGASCRCERCRRPITIAHRLEFSEYSIPAIKDSRIYRCQLGVCDANVALEPIAHVLTKPDNPGVFGIKNKTSFHWDAITSKGVARKVAPNEVVPVKPGITFKIEGEQIVIKAN